jgi:uncharacterized linocin/CFP29 family protein
MDVLGRDTAPFSGRVWQQIDAAVGAVKAANCTARRFLEVDGPYGLGLTSLAGDDDRIASTPAGATAQAWGVRPSVPITVGGAPVVPGADPDEPFFTRGTYLVQSPARPVPMVTSEFVLGVRNVEAFDDECQPLDVQRATRTARDVALEEERLIYYGSPAPAVPGLLTPPAVQPGQFPNTTTLSITARREVVFEIIAIAVETLAARGFSGPYALAAFPRLYTKLYGLLGGTDTTLVDLLRELFAMGVHLVPIITAPLMVPGPPPALAPGQPLGVIVTCGRPYVRLVVGQDWTTTYRGNNGIYHRFVIVSSLSVDISTPDALQVLQS